jgi:hypothetical protein
MAKCPLLAQSGHYNPGDECPPLGGKRASRGVAERPLVTQADIDHWRTSGALAHVRFDNNIAACCVWPAFFYRNHIGGHSAVPVVAIDGTSLVGAECRFAFMPLRAIPSSQKFALKLRRQTPELQL